MLAELAAADRVVGVKQATRAAKEGRVGRLFFACDADPAVLRGLETLCAERGIPASRDYTMAQLGTAAGIAVGASVVAFLKQPY